MLVLVAVAVFAQFLRWHTARLGQPVQGLRHVLGAAGAIHLGAVAGGENRRLQVRADGVAQMVEMLANLVQRKGEAPTHIHRCRVVVQPDGPDRHVQAARRLLTS